MDKWINFIMGVVTYPSWDQGYTMLVKGNLIPVILDCRHYIETPWCPLWRHCNEMHNSPLSLLQTVTFLNTKDSRYIAVQYNVIMYTAQLIRKKFDQISNSRNTTISRPNGRAMGVFRELFGENGPRYIGPLFVYEYIQFTECQQNERLSFCCASW